ncbi:MAG TPA: hypothetical protein VJH75_00860 [Patescibacteria group bacterium]|nr:hypothetical protein [Patescibacteria group bacterium]
MYDENEAKSRDTAWLEGDDEIEMLNSEGAGVYFKREFPDLKRAFLPELKCVVCMDEGTAHKDVNGEGKFCMAGSGILYPAANEGERVRKVAELFIERGITHLTSHGGCGAAGLAYRRDNPGMKPEDVKAEDIEACAKDWVIKVADEMGRMGHEVETSHIDVKEMERPKDFHTARVVYFDAVGGFNPDIEVGLPMGFVVERKYLPVEYTNEEVRVAANIALGHHGLGEKFDSPNHPFIIIIFASTPEELQSLKEEVGKVLAVNDNYKAGKIKIDGMVIEK